MDYVNDRNDSVDGVNMIYHTVASGYSRGIESFKFANKFGRTDKGLYGQPQHNTLGDIFEISRQFTDTFFGFGGIDEIKLYHPDYARKLLCEKTSCLCGCSLWQILCGQEFSGRSRPQVSQQANHSCPAELPRTALGFLRLWCGELKFSYIFTSL